MPLIVNAMRLDVLYLTGHGWAWRATKDGTTGPAWVGDGYPNSPAANRARLRVADLLRSPATDAGAGAFVLDRLAARGECRRSAVVIPSGGAGGAKVTP